MQRNSAAHPNLLSAVALVMFLFTSAAARATALSSPPAEHSTLDFFEIMWTGSPEERLELSADLDEEVSDAITQAEDPAALVADLEAALDAEPDPWIRYSYLLCLARWSEERELDPIFVHALTGNTQSDDWPALIWLSEYAVPGALPLLERLWPARERPVLRPLLVRALVRNGSKEHNREFMDLAGRDAPEDVELAMAAVAALSELADESAIPLLVRMSRSKSKDLAVAAVAGLGEMGHESALAPLVRMTRGEGEVAVAAVWSLALFSQPESLQARLVLVDDEGTGDDIREAAMETLGPEDDPGIFPALRAVVTGTRSQGDPLVRTAWRALRLNAQLDEDGEAMRFLASQEKVMFSTYSCGGFLTFSDEDDELPALRVTPAAGHSLRCWAGPDLALEFEDEPQIRIPSGWPITVGDLYEGPEQTMVRPDDNALFEDCWLPLEQLNWRELTAAEQDQELFYTFWNYPSSADFDLPIDESLSETALLLQDANLIDFFDPGSQSIGAALVLDEIGPEHRDLLLLLSEAGDAPLLQEALAYAWEELE